MQLIKRGRRLRTSQGLRRMVAETSLNIDDLIYPLFIMEGNNIIEDIPSMPGQYYYSVDRLEEIINEISMLGIPSVLLFGLPEKKDESGSEAYNQDGIIQKAIRRIKELNKELIVITDVCMCEYTSHGHCGIVHDNCVDNDCTVDVIKKIALSHVKAGADIVAPSDMMDGRIGAIRELLDKEGYIDTAIMSYSAKYSSSFYGPFRDAAKSAPQFGDRKTYQMDYHNSNEAIREGEQDLVEGADILMVKPALSYMDVIYRFKERFTCPIAAYNVSGEYSMIKVAAANGLIDEKTMIIETLTGIKRSGADLIITYFALDAAKIMRGIY